MHRNRFALGILVFCALSTTLSGESRPRPTRYPSNTIRIGALFSLTGDGSSLGIASDAALHLAERDINAELEELHSPFRVETIVEDTRLEPAVAAQKVQLLAVLGARIVIGPQSSAEAAAVRGYAGAQGMVIVSQGSTASSLAIAGDNLFRLAPNDRVEGAAMAEVIHADGVDTLIPMWRADAGNTGLRNSTLQFFAQSGGITAPGVSYEATTDNFQSKVTALGDAVRAAKTLHPGAHIGIYLASFEEAVDIMNLARLDSDLSSLRWYGGDGVTQSQAILDNPTAAAFAASTFFIAPSVGLDESLRYRWEPISHEIEDLTGFKPDAFALSVYDAAWVAALSAVEGGNYPEVVRTAFVRNVDRYLGLTGSTALDEAGDRRTASFDFWRVVTGDEGPAWVRIH